MIRKDYRAEPVKRMVVMGESNAYGMCAGYSRNEWVTALADCIREFQDEPLQVFNNAIPSNVICQASPGYHESNLYATVPSALDRLEDDMIAYRPDLAVYAYGLNDSRCGHNLKSFIGAYATIVEKTRAAFPDALVVLVSPYWNLQYDSETWAQPEYAESRNGVFDRGGDDLVLSYVQAISDLAVETGALFVDVYSLLEGASWLLHKDACHFNDIGQRMIGLHIFCQIAASCSFLALKSKKIEDSFNTTIHNTGGTSCLPHVINEWRKVDDLKL